MNDGTMQLQWDGFMEVDCIAYGCKGKIRFNPEKMEIQEINPSSWGTSADMMGNWDEPCSACKEKFRLTASFTIRPHFPNEASPEICHASQR